MRLLKVHTLSASTSHGSGKSVNHSGGGLALPVKNGGAGVLGFCCLDF